jgi:hypothetical protein
MSRNFGLAPRHPDQLSTAQEDLAMIMINVTCEDRPDGGVRVYSDQLPGLILSGKDRAKVLAGIEPAVKVFLQRQGVDSKRLRIDATFVCEPRTAAGRLD